MNLSYALVKLRTENLSRIKTDKKQENKKIITRCTRESVKKLHQNVLGNNFLSGKKLITSYFWKKKHKELNFAGNKNTVLTSKITDWLKKRKRLKYFYKISLLMVFYMFQDQKDFSLEVIITSSLAMWINLEVRGWIGSMQEICAGNTAWIWSLWRPNKKMISFTTL